MFVRQSKSRSTTSFQLVQNYRDAGKVKTRVLCHLGEHPTPEEALAAWREESPRLRSIGRDAKADRLNAKIATLEHLIR